MNHVRLLTALFALMLLVSFTVYAGDTKQEAQQEAQQEVPKELKNQTHCPVMGGKIDSTVYTDLQGQRVYHCCPMCSKQLTEDPNKFFKKAAAESVLFENIQTSCPVSGKKLEEKEAFTDHEGRRIYFCCAGCEAPFNKEPQEYLSKLDAPAEIMEGHDMKGHEEHDMKKGHEGENH